MENSDPISFDNTQIAFANKTDKGLRRAYWLFKIINNNFLVSTGPVLLKLAQAAHLPVLGIIKKTLYKQFVGGETIEECNTTIAKLGNFGVGTILDFAVEGASTEEDFNHTTREVMATIDRAAKDPNIPFSVFKPSGIMSVELAEKISYKMQLTSTEKIEWQKTRERFELICKNGYEKNVPVFVDAEESWIQEAIDNMVEEMMTKYNKQNAIVYNTIQLYRHDRLDFLINSHQNAVKGNYFLGLKLVRGAYMEKERKRAEKLNYTDPIHNDKASTDRDYDAAQEYCMQNIDRISFCSGTHNEHSCKMLAISINNKKMNKKDNRVYFSQLLGMSDHISFNLSNKGFNVAKYVPYGPVKTVIPYLTRRAQENTSIAGQMGRELQLIIKEMKRRKSEIIR
ncbi:MAG: proline dehydrogenase family protein [Bacteroidia bacterium]